MKGYVLAFDSKTETGAITGDNDSRYAFSLNDWKGKRFPERGLRIDFDTDGNRAIEIYDPIVPVDEGASVSPASPLNLEGMHPHYAAEFQRIHATNGVYKGEWNWAAFLLGPLWALLNGAWVSALAAILTSLFTVGFAWLIWAIVYGYRGTYIYYRVYARGEQPVV